MKFVYVIAWVAGKFRINTPSVVFEMEKVSRGLAEGNYPFSIQQVRVVFILNFHCYTHACYSSGPQ